MTSHPDIRENYAMVLRFHAHALIAMGYGRMNASSFAAWEEPAITGELVRVTREFLESDDAPAWAVYYSIGDDPPLNVPDRFGKSRPRVDIEFERTGVRGCRPRLRFEAKRLNKKTGHSVGAYLGSDGMGCFISGKYPLTHDEAGMLGYVQSENEEDWSNQIENILDEQRQKYSVVQPLYHQQKICSLQHTYVSHHYNVSCSAVILVHHILLRFY
jgi:hypothetical protein